MTDGVQREWLEELYPDLQRLAHGLLGAERPGHTLSATAVVHEAFLRLSRERTKWETRQHFLSVAALTMRRVLMDHARRHLSERRGGMARRVPLDLMSDPELPLECNDWLAFDRALDALESAHPRAHRVIKLRFFLGLSTERVAAELDRSVRAIHDDWSFARAFLRKEIESEGN